MELNPELRVGQRYRLRLRLAASAGVDRQVIGTATRLLPGAVELDLRPLTPWLHRVCLRDVVEIWETDAPAQLERPLPREVKVR